MQEIVETWVFDFRELSLKELPYDASTIGTAVRRFIESRSEWKGTGAQLLGELEKVMEELQYRSAIFYHNQKQKEIAEKSKKELEKEGVYKDPIVTEITPFRNFYVAEDYHKNYYENNQNAPYCNFIIDPKVNKLLQKYGNNVKEEYIR
jgi:hypothetical protein